MTDSARHRSSTIRPVRIAIPPLSTPRPTSPTPTSGIRAHLAHILPRHAAFTLTVTLHQLNNVPLVHGEFGLRWKIKGVTSHSGNRILDKVKARKVKADLVPKGSDTDNGSLCDASDAHSIANSSSTNDHASAHGHPVTIPAVVVTASTLPGSIARSTSGVSSIASIASGSSSASNAHPVQETETRDTLTKHHYSPAKGSTPFVKLKEHSVVWEKTLKFVVQMSVGRDNGGLGDCPAKFVVMQRVVHGDPDAPRNPRLGVVHLNFAQYVDSGVVTRRYLLRQSKTNATLKLTVHLEHTAGEPAYVAPPLPRDEILSGVAGILESSDIYRTRPRVADLYTRGSSDSSYDDDDGASGTDASSSNGPSQNHTHDLHHATIKKPKRPFEIAKLPTINDPRGTEKLIEALFNPVPVTQPGKVTPFTYLVEVDGEGDGDGNGDGKHGCHTSDSAAHEDQDARRSVEDADDDSLYEDSHDECDNQTEGLKSDYHSLRSQPSVRSSLRSKRSTQSLVNKDRSKVDEETAIGAGVQVPNGLTERRTWWQKVLSPPSTSG